MLRLYNALLTPLRPVVEVWAAWKGLLPHQRSEWAERRARHLPAMRPGGVWIHGSSVGEARIVAGLSRRLRATRPGLPLAVSAYTTTGRSLLPRPPAVDAAFFVPIDFQAYARRLLRSLRPGLLTLVETEIWPNLLHQAQTSGVPVIVLNGRLSAGRMKHYRRLSRLYRPLLGGLARVGAQSSADAARFVELGVPSSAVAVTGNVKYDLPAPEVDVDALRRRLGLAAERPVLVAGSTGEGEDPIVLAAFERARRRHDRLLLVLAPRHPERVAEVERLARGSGLTTGRLSCLAAPADRLDVLLVDTVGELASLYRLASVAFVGGSLVPIGGHNVLEPADAGVPVLYGPHTANVSEAAAALEQSGGGRTVADEREMAEALEAWLTDPHELARVAERAATVVRQNRGALARSVDLVLETLEGPASRTAVGDV